MTAPSAADRSLYHQPGRCASLADATVIDLFRSGYLQLIYLMIASLKQVPVLAREE